MSTALERRRQRPHITSTTSNGDDDNNKYRPSLAFLLSSKRVVLALCAFCFFFGITIGGVYYSDCSSFDYAANTAKDAASAALPPPVEGKQPGGKLIPTSSLPEPKIRQEKRNENEPKEKKKPTPQQRKDNEPKAKKKQIPPSPPESKTRLEQRKDNEPKEKKKPTPQSSPPKTKTKRQTAQEKFHFFYSEKALNANRTKTYPFVPKKLLSKCGLNKYSTQSTLIYKPLKRSIAYVKPHKTGGSTVANIINRIVYGRGAIKMIPANNVYMGWPGEFPGKIKGMENVLARQKYDAYNAHSVFSNRSHIANYVKQPMVVLTILREPISRTVSAYNFFEISQNLKAKTWREHIDKGRSWDSVGRGWYRAVSWNNLAFALGWYHQPHINFSTTQDRNVTAIRAFIEKIDAEMDLVMILEDLEKSLVLLKEQVLPELDVTELVWIDYDGKGKHVTNETKKASLYPTESEKEELKDLLLLDSMIYDHFRDKLNKQWDDAIQKEASSPSSKSNLIQIKDSLRCAHDALLQNFEDPDVVPSITKQFFSFTGGQFNDLHLYRQVQKFGEIETSEA